jgi:hypothetical protein
MPVAMIGRPSPGISKKATARAGEYAIRTGEQDDFQESRGRPKHQSGICLARAIAYLSAWPKRLSLLHVTPYRLRISSTSIYTSERPPTFIADLNAKISQQMLLQIRLFMC